MFSTGLQKRLQLLDEKKTDGEAKLILQLQNPCILFSKLEDKKLRYFKNQKCADYILYEWKENSWEMHIFELKRSVSFSSWEQIKEQAKGAMQNGLAIA